MATDNNNNPTEWVSSRHLQHFIHCGDAAGLPMDKLLADVNLRREQLDNAQGQVPVATLDLLLDTLNRKVPFPIGLYLARDVRPATLGLLGYIAQACSTFAEVLEAVTRFNGLLSNIGHAQVHHHPGVLEVQWQCLSSASPLFQRHACEYVLGAFVNLMRLLLPNQATLVDGVYFAHSAPTGGRFQELYQKQFRCPVYFNANRSRLHIPVHLLKQPLTHGDSHLKHLLEQHAQQEIAEQQQFASVTQQVEEHIIQLLPRGQASKEQVAERLGISPRSLQRHLRNEGCGYRELYDQIRSRLAKEQLSQAGHPLRHIAQSLCFSSQQAFIRWFREQQGMTPGQYRQLQLQLADPES